MLKYIFEKFFWKLCEHEWEHIKNINYKFDNSSSYKTEMIYICTKCLKKKTITY